MLEEEVDGVSTMMGQPRTVCLLIFNHPPPWPISATDSRHACSTNHAQIFYFNYVHISTTFSSTT